MDPEDRQQRHEQAAEIARLFVQLADERPAVLDALHALLRALTHSAPGHAARAPERSEAETSAEPSDEPSSPAETVIPIDTDSKAGDPSAPSAVPALTAVPGLSPTPLPPVKPAAQAPRLLTPKDQASFAMLLSRFGDVSSTNGLGSPSRASMQERVAPAHPTRWADDVSEAKLLARLLRAQARRLRSIRLALHDKTALPPVDHVLADERIDDWTATESVVRTIKPRELKEGERWYALAARAAAAIADWLEEHPAAELGYGLTPDAFRDRLQCLANAQKGIYCWLEEALGIRGRCAVQDRVISTLKAWVARDYFAVYLPSGMQLAQRITSGARDELERALQRFDLEHAASDEPAGGHAQSGQPAAAEGAPRPVTRPQAVANAEPERFESVHDAFLTARREFADGLIVFTDRAEESAEDSAFKRPDEVYEFFGAMHDIAVGLVSGALDGVPMIGAFAQRGFKSKLSSDSSMNRFHRFYHMAFEGSEIELSLHVTLGSRNQNTCMSIHWWYDTDRKRFVVGHCGKHLPNSLT